jgi:hypothetical protein
MLLPVLLAAAVLPAQHAERITTERGPIYLWSPGPPSREPIRAVIYVHGYWTSTDEAFTAHALEAQFRASGRDALFIVPRAPSSPREPIFWPELAELLARVERESGRRISREQITLAGHSGAYRTLRRWLGHPGIEQLILLDAIYGDTSPFERWLRGEPSARMTIVSRSTERAAKKMISRLDELRDRVTHQRAEENHMEIVTRGLILPAILRFNSTSTSARSS